MHPINAHTVTHQIFLSLQFLLLLYLAGNSDDKTVFPGKENLWHSKIFLPSLFSF